MTLFAQWKSHTYTIRYDANGGAGTVEEQRNIAYDANVTLADGGFEREGHTLKSWNTKADGSGRSFGLGEVTSMVGGQSREGETVTLYAQWAKAPTIHRVKAVQEEAKRFLIYTYVTEDGSGIDRVQFPTWSSEGGQDDIQQDWQTSAAARGEQGDWTIGHEKYNWRYEVRPEDHKGGLGSYNTVVHAYGRNGEVATKSLSYGFAFTISYQLDGGLVEGNPEGYSPEQDDFTLINPTRRGHTFLGWTGSNGDVPSREVTIKKGTTGDLRYRARWAVNDYTLRFDANGGAGAPEDFGFAYGTRPNITDAKPTRAGYDFVEWNTRPDGSGASLEAGGTIPNEWRDMTVYAQWEAHSATVTYEANCESWKGRLPSPAETHVGEATRIADATLARLGATMTGWNTRADGRGRSYRPGASVTWDTDEDVTLYAQWRGERCVIRYDANGGVGRTADTWYDGLGKATVSGCGFSDPERSFIEWNTRPDGSGTSYRAGETVDVQMLGATTVTLFARWSAGSPTLRFDGNYGYTPSSTRIAAGRAVGPLPDSYRAGYAFLGWYEGETRYDASTIMPNRDVTLKARWEYDSRGLPDHLVNSDMSYMPPAGEVGYLQPSTGQWMNIGEYLENRWAGRPWPGVWRDVTGWVHENNESMRRFGWLSYSKDTTEEMDNGGRAQIVQPCGVRVSKSGWGLELNAHTVGAVYQDIRTIPGAIYRVKLSHESTNAGVDPKAPMDSMVVLIGPHADIDCEQLTLDEIRARGMQPIRMTRTKSTLSEADARRYYSSYPLRNTNVIDPTDWGQVGWSGTTITSPGIGAGGDSYEGWYRIPEGQDVTRFTFKSLSFYPKVENGNKIADISFERWFPLRYDANGGWERPGQSLPRASWDEVSQTAKLYYEEGTSAHLDADGGRILQKSEGGRELTFLGWSTERLDTVRTKAEYDYAKSKITDSRRIVGSEDNVVYAVWARQPEVRFHTQTPDVPDPATQTLSQVFLPSGAKAGRATDPGWDTSRPFAGRAGWYFGGWFTDPGCTSAFDFSSDIWQDTDLYAKWYRVMYVRFNYSADSYIQRDTDQRELGIEDAKGKEIRLPDDLAVREGARTLLPTMPMAYGSYSRIVDSGVTQDYDVALTPIGWSWNPEHATDPFGNDLVNERQRLQAPWYDDVGSPYVDVYVKYSPYLFDGVTAYH